MRVRFSILLIYIHPALQKLRANNWVFLIRFKSVSAALSCAAGAGSFNRCFLQLFFRTTGSDVSPGQTTKRSTPFNNVTISLISCSLCKKTSLLVISSFDQGPCPSHAEYMGCRGLITGGRIFITLFWNSIFGLVCRRVRLEGDTTTSLIQSPQKAGATSFKHPLRVRFMARIQTHFEGFARSVKMTAKIIL